MTNKLPIFTLALLFWCACGGAAKTQIGPSEPAVGEQHNTEQPPDDIAEPVTEEDATTETPVDVGGLPFHAVGPVAKVDGVEISAHDFNAEVARVTAMLGPLASPLLQGLKTKIVSHLVNRALFEKVHADPQNEVTEKEIDVEFNKSFAALGSTPAEFVRRSGRSESELRGQLAESLRLTKHLRRTGRVTVDASDVRKRYDEDRERFSEPEKTRASHILLKLDRAAPSSQVQETRRRADGLSKLASAPGADFAQLAREHSEGPTGPKGGDLGYFERGRMVPEFEKAAWALKPGEVSEPVRSAFGFHIIKVFDRTPAVEKTFSDVEAQIRGELERALLRKVVAELTAELRAAASVEEFPDNIVDAPQSSSESSPPPE